MDILSQISPTPARNHILNPLGKLLVKLLEVNTANWLSPLKYKVFDKYNSSTIKKDSELPCLS